MSRIVITGGSGLLGSNLAKIATDLGHEVYAAYFRNKVNIQGVDFFRLDISSIEDMSTVDEIGPEIIIHCAAITNLDYCEEHPDEAYLQNVRGSINLAETAKKLDAYLIHISTDAVFDGKKGNYSEKDKANPLNIYGGTKLEAEREVSSIHPGSAIVRTNLYGWNKRDKYSLAEWMLAKLKNDEELTGFSDVYFTPILINDMVEPLFKLWEMKYAGIINIAGSERISKLEFAYVLAEVFNENKELIRPIKISDLELKAKRALDISLDTSKLAGILNHSMPNVKEGLEKMKSLQDDGYLEELKHG